MNEYHHYDPRLAEFHVQVYDLMRGAILETGTPMRQAEIANKLRAARATVRNALVDLDKWGLVVFTRFSPHSTTLTDNRRRLTIDPDKATSPPPATPMPWDIHG